jgi:hypothetical protein
MTDELGDAFDEASETDEATNALFRQAQSLDDTKRYAEGLFHEGSLYSSPVIQGETDLARATWQKAEQMSGGHVVDKAVEGYELLHDGNPKEVWEDIEPNQPDSLDFYTDRTGGSAVAGFQTGMEMEASLTPGSPLAPAGKAVYDEWQELKKSNFSGDPDHGIPFKNPEIPDTDAVVGSDVSDQVVAPPDVDDVVAYPTDASDDSTDSDTTTYDAPLTETSTYDTSSYEAPTSDLGGAFGSANDDTGSSFTDF